MGGRLEGRIGLVTGAASGIGQAITRAFVAEGGQVVAVDAVGVQDPGPGVVAVQADVTDRLAIEQAVARAQDEFGGLHVLCNVAGITGVIAPTGQYPREDWDRVLAVNLTGAFTTVQAALPALTAAGAGSIVNMASGQALVGVPGMPAYAASKGGLIALTRVLAVEYAATGVRANAIAPGMIDTPMTRSFAAEVPGEAMAALAAQIPAGRLGSPEDIARAVVFLASEESSYMTGSVITVDGGFTAH